MARGGGARWDEHKNSNQPTMEDEVDDANTARVCNNEAFEAAPLSGANASWQRERWGDTMTDHGEDPAGDREAGEGE